MSGGHARPRTQPVGGGEAVDVADLGDEHRRQHPPELNLDEARRRGADLVVEPSDPYPFAERHRAQLERVSPVVFVDGRDLLWWGARTRHALYRLAEVLHEPRPDLGPD